MQWKWELEVLVTKASHVGLFCPMGNERVRRRAHSDATSIRKLSHLTQAEGSYSLDANITMSSSYPLASRGISWKTNGSKKYSAQK